MNTLSAHLPRLAYTVDECAEVLRVSPRTVRTLIARAELQAHHIGRRVLVSDEALRRFIAVREAAEGPA